MTSNITTLYGELNKFIVSGDTERALKAANRILHTAPDETKAFHCKIVSLIHLNKFAEAVQALELKPQFADGLIFEKAYCLYRLNDPKEAFKIIEQSSNEIDSRIPELKAQILYRLEEFEKCREVYRSIFKNQIDEYQIERAANFCAVDAGVLSENPNATVYELRDDTYELCYNKACGLIAKGEYVAAEKALRLCEKMGEKQICDDDGTEEDVEDELGIIRVQLAFCMQKQGRDKEALALYQNVMKRKPDDVALVAVASNNMAVINRDHNIFDSKKKMKSATSDATKFKLNSQQRKIIAMNNCLFQVLAGANNALQLCNALEKNYPDLKYKACAFRSVGKFKEGNLSDAVKDLTSHAAQDKKHALYLRLLAVHLLLSKEQRGQAIKILENMDEDSFRPGIVGALVMLHLGMNNKDGASKILEDAVNWYRREKARGEHLNKIYKVAASYHLRNDQPGAATQCLEEMLALDPSSTQIMARLVMAYAQTNSSKAMELSKRLPPIDTHYCNIADLESSNWLMGLKNPRPKNIGETPPTYKMNNRSVLLLNICELLNFSLYIEKRVSTPHDGVKKRKTKKRKIRLPKNYVEGSLPDPERWLPKYERSGYRKKRDRRNKDIIKGSQGAANAAESYEYKMVESPKPETVSSNTTSNSRHIHGHKKKRGRR